MRNWLLRVVPAVMAEVGAVVGGWKSHVFRREHETATLTDVPFDQEEHTLKYFEVL